VRGNARRQQLDPTDTAIVSKASLVKADEGGARIAVTMDVTMPNVADLELAKGLIRMSHQTCPYSRATRGNVEVAFTVNGVEVDGI
jgi:organic hydroperoxide reductase OsmC/OhrA